MESSNQMYVRAVNEKRRESGKERIPPFFPSQTPAVSPFFRSPALSIVSTDREPATGYVRIVSTGKIFGSKGSRDGEFQKPLSVCINDQGQIVVSDWLNDRIQLLTPNGQPVFTVGTTGPERVTRPLSCLAHRNKFIVSDGVRHCVKVFDKLPSFFTSLEEKAQLTDILVTFSHVR